MENGLVRFICYLNANTVKDLRLVSIPMLNTVHRPDVNSIPMHNTVYRPSANSNANTVRDLVPTYIGPTSFEISTAVDYN